MKDFSRPTQFYILSVIFLAAFLAIWQFNQPLAEDPWLLLGACVVASFLQSIAVFGATARSTYSLSWIIYAFVLVLLGPAATLITVLVSHLVEGMLDRNRLVWYIQAFNIGNFFIAITLSGLIMSWGTAFGNGALLSFLTVIAALISFTYLNHLLVALVIKLARGQTFAQSGLFGWFTLFLDFTLLCLGYAAAIIWQTNQVALTLVLFISFMLYEALKIPALERKTEIDPKTQLYNARYFTEALEDELIRSKRFKRPLTLIMADLDLLRNINNTYGHLAGDVVLQGIADILQEMTREYDIVARFGGEEFSILLPETKPEDAYVVAERVRQRVEATEFKISTSVHPIRATMSFGIAGLKGEKETPDNLIHAADMALYRAKETGRNRTCVYDPQSDPEDGSNQKDWAKLNIVAKVNPKVVATDVMELEDPIDVPSATLQADETLFQVSNNEDADEAAPSTPSSSATARRNYPEWLTNLYIFSLATLTAAFAYNLVTKSEGSIEWVSILFFAGIILVMETASIEIYVKDTTVSTSAALLVAGIILFDVPAAILLGAVIAFVSFAKRRIKISRFLFNSSNHIFGGLIVAAMLGANNELLQSWSLLKLLVVGAGATGLIYISTTLLLTIAIGLDSGMPFKSIWMERFRWLLPYYLTLGLVAAALVFSYLAIDITGIFIIILPLLMLRFSQKQYIDHTESLVHSLQSTNVQLLQQANEITRLNEEMLLTLARSLDLRDPHVMEHSKHVSRYAVCLAEEMGLPPEQVENIRKAGLLHDVGKLGIPEDILFKPSHLTASEYEIVKDHVKIGAELIQGCHSLERLVPFILHHHEWHDGNGYPSGLIGDEIPLEARILSLADAVEAMASDRPYKVALSPGAILREVKQFSGTQFDPVVVKAFARIITREGDAIIVNSARHVQARKEKEAIMYPPHY